MSGLVKPVLHYLPAFVIWSSRRDTAVVDPTPGMSPTADERDGRIYRHISRSGGLGDANLSSILTHTLILRPPRTPHRVTYIPITADIPSRHEGL